MRNLLLIMLGFALLVLQAALGTLVSIHPLAPNLVLPMVIYLGVSHEVHILRGASISFVVGYLLDSFCGSPIGLHTFVLVATFMVARGAGIRLFLRGPLYQILLTFFVGLLQGGTILALRAIFERPAPFPDGDALSLTLSLVVPALITAIVSPPIFWAVQRIDRVATRRAEEGVATP